MNCDIDRAHQQYASELDPLLPVMSGLTPGEGDRMLSVSVGTSVGYARAHFTAVDPDSVGALWGPLRQYSLTARISGPERAEVLRRLLRDWLGAASDVTGDWETSASVTIPSRDPDLRNPLLELGFAPVIVVAARKPFAAAPPGSGAANIRPAGRRDLVALTQMAVRLHEFDVESGMLTSRPGAAQLLRDMLTEHLDASPGWTWIAESDGAPVGFVYAQPPATAGWIASMAPASTPPAYVAEMFVDPSARSAGIGADLANTVHRAVDQAGVPLTLLHHALPNPYSTPFWARMGYRPLWTTWQRRPLSGPSH